MEDREMRIGASRRNLLYASVLLGLTLLQVPAIAGQAMKSYEPRVGQAGKDVVWVPTPDALVEKMLALARVTPEDYLIDLGSGDGRTVIAAAKRGLRAHGIEYNADMVELSKRNAAAEGVADKATFARADLFQSDFSRATVITMFLLPQINLKLRPKILDLKPGTRIVSNSFTMGEWEPDETASTTDDCTGWCTALLWIVPAKAAGSWELPDGELNLQQNYQIVTGTWKSGDRSSAIMSGRLRGEEIYLKTADAEYRGQVIGDALTLASSKGDDWRARRLR
jgi:SAM-dependent methyltransferase